MFRHPFVGCLLLRKLKNAIRFFQRSLFQTLAPTNLVWEVEHTADGYLRFARDKWPKNYYFIEKYL